MRSIDKRKWEAQQECQVKSAAFEQFISTCR